MPSHAPIPSAAKARRLLAAASLCVVSASLGPARASAQVEPMAPVKALADSTPRAEPATQQVSRVLLRGASPRGAFLRAVLVPGWGHAAIGAWNRGAFYVTVESATAWALVKAQKRVQEASERIAFREGVVRAELAAQNQIDPDTVQAALDADETLQDLQSLEKSRRQQREDWVALGIFLTFLSGADAYVSAHLQHFPQPIEVNALPVGGGRTELWVSLKLPR